MKWVIILVGLLVNSTLLAEDKIIHVQKNLEKEIPYDTDSSRICAKIKISYPILVDTGINNRDSLNWFIVQWVGGKLGKLSPEERIDKFINNALKVCPTLVNQDEDGIVYPMPYIEETEVKITNSKHDILSLYLSDWGSGGAHPNHLTYFTNIDIKKVSSLKLDELFIEGYRVSLDSLGENSFRESRAIAPHASLDSLRFNFPGGHFQLNQNFLIDSTGLIFFFNDYEIASYAQGPTKFTIPYSQLINLVKPDGPLAPIIRDKIK